MNICTAVRLSSTKLRMAFAASGKRCLPTAVKINGKALFTKDLQRSVGVMIAETPRKIDERRLTWTIDSFLTKQIGVRISKTILCCLLHCSGMRSVDRNRSWLVPGPDKRCAQGITSIP